MPALPCVSCAWPLNCPDANCFGAEASDEFAATDVAGKVSETDLLMNSNSGRNAYHAIAATTKPLPIQIFFFISLLLLTAFHLKPMRISQPSRRFVTPKKLKLAFVGLGSTNRSAYLAIGNRNSGIES